MTPFASRKFGWIPDLPDRRDYPYSKYFKVAKKLPPLVDLRPQCSAVEDQETLGSCTAQALVGSFEFLDQNKIDQSRLFLYYNEREIEGTIPFDSGAMIRDGIKSLNHTGICPEAMWPYTISKFTEKPPQRCYTEAEKHQIISYLRLANLAEIKSCLADGFPVTFGFTVYENFYETDSSGYCPMPSGGVLGGHAVLAVGYDDEKQCLIVRNSWGNNWGLNGYFYMPYAYVTPDLTDDYWTIRQIELCGEYNTNSFWQKLKNLWHRFVEWFNSLFV
jgi:C1A family cysteine protease